MKLLGVIIFLHVQALVSAMNLDCCKADIKIVGAEPNHTVNGLYKYQGTGPYFGMPLYKMLKRNYTLFVTASPGQEENIDFENPKPYVVTDPSGKTLALPKRPIFELTCAEDLTEKEWAFPQNDNNVSTLGLSCVSEEYPGCCIEDIKIVGAELNDTINGLYRYQGTGGIQGWPLYKMLERNYTLIVISPPQNRTIDAGNHTKTNVFAVWAYVVMDPSRKILAEPKNQTFHAYCAEDLSGQEWLFPQYDYKGNTLGISCVSDGDSGRCCPIKTVQGGPDSSLGGTYTLVKTLESPPESFCKDGCVYQKDGVHYCFKDEDTGYTVDC